MRQPLLQPVGAVALAALALSALSPGSTTLAQDGPVSPAPDRPAGGPPALDDEQTATLSRLRDRYRAELRALPPTPEERLAALEVTPAEEALIRDQIHALEQLPRRGSGEFVLDAQAGRVRPAPEFDLPAIPFLIETAARGSHLAALRSAEALGRLARGEQFEAVRWLCYELDAPRPIIALFGQGPPAGFPEANHTLEAALQAIIGLGRADELEEPAPVDRPLVEHPALALERAFSEAIRAQEAWTIVWSEARQEWREDERQRARARGELLRKLALVERGVVPAGDEPPR